MLAILLFQTTKTIILNMDNQERISVKEDFQSLLEFPKKIMDSISEVWSHNTEDHNCRTIERDRLTWRLNN
jgi:hypothetical protein